MGGESFAARASHLPIGGGLRPRCVPKQPLPDRLALDAPPRDLQRLGMIHGQDMQLAIRQASAVDISNPAHQENEVPILEPGRPLVPSKLSREGGHPELANMLPEKVPHKGDGAAGKASRRPAAVPTLPARAPARRRRPRWCRGRHDTPRPSHADP